MILQLGIKKKKKLSAVQILNTVCPRTATLKCQHLLRES